MSEATTRPATWRVVIAFIFDLLISFFIFGFIIASITGDTTEGGFQLNGLPALILFALVIIYMVGMPRVGGRLFQRLFKAI
ncbi:hypothetical protein A3731_32550 [Roseovarius sp. HI0049]|nr:hypothetical protein A3731_05940 [Roseovarius sp. HI0049]KZY46097.1 hypothetical protein A3731_32550 [Roseovarius sp. HI0049]